MLSPNARPTPQSGGKRKEKEKENNPLPQLQELRKPRHRHILRPLKRPLLLRITPIAPDREAVRRAREILIVVLEVQARDHAVDVRFELGCEHGGVLRRDDLHGDGDGVDFFLCQEGGVGGGDAVN